MTADNSPLLLPRSSTPPPPPSPASPGMRSHAQRPSVSSIAAAAGAMPPPASYQHHAKRPSSRITDGVTSRSSDDDGKTAVKVAVRVRPPLQPTDPGYDLIPQRFRDSTCEVPTPTSLSVQSPQGKKLFVFDHVFPQDTSQEGVWQYLSDSVASFVKGYNVSILAYGQSGSGKSYTMGTSGPEDQADPQIMGIVPRAAQLLFDTLNASALPKTGLQTPKRYSTQALPTYGSLARGVNGVADRNWTLKATYVEIYQEQLRDLLVPDSVPVQDRAQVAIREDTKGRILVTGLTQLTINSVEDLLAALNFGSAIRQTDATNLNARSSRSHAVFSLNLIQKRSDGAPVTPKHEKRFSTPIETLSNAENVVTLDSKLHFVDLAGSERLKNTGATGDRAREGISINAGLASLGKVISQLSSKHSLAHISYRDSKLTRLLQDSLGGNAITFMIACVTPAVFHLSETLNTVHYAQRARAIQSKPEIQSSRDESDKQAAIDRLRAEVSFLRDQIRHSEHAEAKGSDVRGRSDRHRGREAELETQLMDMQENYNTLSNRHARLIADLSQARDGENGDVSLPIDALGDNAMERVKRSSSFADAVEQMVLEYEKTIQSLESSLSKTRSSLSNSESTLLEKETRIVYMETMQQQLQTRMQKAIDREANNEAYVHDLEAQIAGSTSDGEKNSTLVTELRKELARVRESEVNNEEYISTLEERLAEAEQDQESMQREIDRLEHVVERQRSIGRLDNLLGELDTIRGHDTPMTNGNGPFLNGHSNGYETTPTDSRSASSAAQSRDEDFDDARAEFAKPKGLRVRSATQDVMKHSPALVVAHSVAQDDFMGDKVENLTQELFDLRSEHENVMTDYEKLQQKYQTALETLAKLEYDKETRKLNGDEDATTFLEDAGVNGEGEGERPSSSRSLLEELSSLPRRTSSCEDLKDKVGGEQPSFENGEEMLDDASHVALPADEDDKDKELEILRRMKTDNENTIAELTASYQSLHDRHEGTVAHVEDLKQELSKAQRATSTSPSFKSHFNKRKSADLLGLHGDPATKSITSLRNIGAENIGQASDIRQVFDMNLNTVMTELTNRHERMQSLEAELTSVKKDMESKQTIIAGLTRERGSLKASLGVDFSVVSQMREQLLEGENRIRALQEQNATREKEFHDEIESLKATLANQVRPLPTPTEERSMAMPGGFASSPGVNGVSEEQAMDGVSREALEAEHAQVVSKLQDDVSSWETKHNETIEAMKASENKLLATIADLENSMRKAQAAKAVEPDPANTAAVAAVSLEEERAAHMDVNEALQRQVEEYKATSHQQLSKLEQLETSYANILKQVAEDGKARDLNAQELQTHKGLVANLENQLQVHKSAIAIHQESLESLQDSHSRELDILKTTMASTERQSSERYAAMDAEHKRALSDLQSQLITSQNENADLLRNASSALGYWTDPTKLHAQIKGLVEEGKELHSRHLKTTNELKGVQEELQTALSKHNDFEGKITELSKINDESIRALEKSMEKEKKSSRLVEELEEQLNQNYDSRHASNVRGINHADLAAELESQKRKTQALEYQIETLHRQSAQSNGSGGKDRESLQPETNALGRNGSGSSQGRKTPTNAGLPTPPPSIPLPPLPTSPTSINGIAGSIDGRANSPPLPRNTPPNGHGPSPPGSRNNNNPDPATAQHIEEQETRIRTIEKHLYAEKQLTATLEEALVDLETSANRTKAETDTWRKKCAALEEELSGLKKERSSNSRVSLQAVEEEREMRVRAEKARQALEERMRELNSTKKKKKSSLNCF